MRTHADAEFALILGDLADNAEPASHTAVRDHFRQLKRPIYTQIGNHDHLSQTDRRSYEQTFPSQTNYWFEHRGWQFVGIDSTEGTHFEKTRVQDTTLAWLDTYLPKMKKERPTVLFTHFPLATGVKMAPLNGEDVLNRFREFNLRGVFSGHYHAYTQNPFQGIDVVTNRCCSRLRNNHDGTKEKGYWLVTAEAGKITRQFVEFNPVQS
jgi:predicted MPP superfamily phosphohydrolase